MATAGIANLFGSLETTPSFDASVSTYFSTTTYKTIDGFDLIWQQQQLQSQMQKAMNDIYAIEANANLSDTEKMFSIQMAMNTWSSIANLRTNMLKSVSDALKSIGRNVN